MKKVNYFVFALGISILGVSCQSFADPETTQNESGVSQFAKDISVQEFKSLMNENAIVLDVRRKIEFDAGHLEGAINIDYFSNSFLDEVGKLDKSKVILVYCASGGRSSNSMRKMTGLGFNSIYNMIGGFGAWRKSNLPFVK